MARIAHFTGTPGENPLRGQISSALQVDLLVQQVQEHAAELAREQYVTDTFLETVPDRIYFKDCQGRITRANKAHALRLGLHDPREELGKTDFDFFPHNIAYARNEEEQAILRTGQAMINKEVVDTNPDGNTIWSLVIKMPLRDERGDIIGTFGISRDITALKLAEQELVQFRDHLAELVKERTTDLTRSNARLRDEVVVRTRIEQALRDSEQQYRLLADNVPDGIVIVQSGKLVFGNTGFGEMVGVAPSDLLTTDLAQIFHPSTRHTLQRWLEQETSDFSAGQHPAEAGRRVDSGSDQYELPGTHRQRTLTEGLFLPHRRDRNHRASVAETERRFVSLDRTYSGSIPTETTRHARQCTCRPAHRSVNAARELVQAFYAYDWPGNVRELQNVLQRYLATRNIQAVLQSLGVSARSSSGSLNLEAHASDLKLPDAIEALEKRMIADALTQTGYHIGNTAELLGMPRRTLQNKLKKYAFTLKRTLS